MRVGLLIYGSLDTVSGGYLYDRKLVAHLVSAGDTVEIVSLPWRNYPANLLDNFSAGLVDQIAALDLDVLIQDELNHPSLFFVNRRLKGRVRHPIVSLVHHLRISEAHPGLFMPLYRAVETRYLRSVDAFIFNSRTTQQVVGQFAGRARPAVVAHPGGDRLGVEITEAAVLARAAGSGPIRLLFLGSLIPRKGFHTLLEALENLRPADWTLSAAGSLAADPGYAGRMQAFVTRKGWEENVTFYGSLPDDRLRPVLMESQLVVVPSQYEGFGIAYLEGMSAGLPAIGSTGGAAHEIIRDGENGYLIEPGDAVGLAQRLQTLLGERQILAEMGIRARETFEAHPVWYESMSRVRAFLNTLVR